MQYLEGRTLQECIEGKPLKTATILDLGIQMADALDAAHARGIIHRDIKPTTIFVTTSSSQSDRSLAAGNRPFASSTAYFEPHCDFAANIPAESATHHTIILKIQTREN